MAFQPAVHYSWGSMLRTTRAAVAVVVLGGIALVVPPQTRDMLAFLDADSRGSAIGFEIALFVFAASGWFWSRAALAARFGIEDSKRDGTNHPNFNWAAYRFLPRLILIGCFLIGVVLAVESDKWWTVTAAVGLGIVAFLLAVYRPRAHSPGLPAAQRGSIGAWLGGGARLRLTALLHGAPFGARFARILLIIGLLPLAFGFFEAFIWNLRIANIVAAVFPGPAIVLLLLGLMIGPLVATTFVFDGLTLQRHMRGIRIGPRRPPVISALLLYVFVLVPTWFQVHSVRIVDGPSPTPKPLGELFDEWVEACAPGKAPIEPIIVAVSGGATRAGLWGAAVLDQVLQAQRPGGPALFAVSSVSGGSLGAAGAMTLLSLEKVPCRTEGLQRLRAASDTTVPLAGDALGPLLGGWLLNDIPRSFLAPAAAVFRWIGATRPNGGDSAEAIEHGFEHLWSVVKPDGAPGWDRPFLSLFYPEPAKDYRKGMPLWFANGTDATTGNRVITSPIDVPDHCRSKDCWPFRGARDFRALMGADVSVATAINNTARFPYLEPFGEMLPLGGGSQVGSLVDGGYFENEGLQTALELAGWLAERQRGDGRTVLPIIVQATGDGEADVDKSEVMTCGNISDGAFIPDTKHSAWQILAPLVGLYHVRGGHSAVLLRQAHDDFCKDPEHPRFVHFYLPADNDKSIPLNWVLSDTTGRFIWNAFTNKQVSNGSEREKLRSMLAPQSTAAVVVPE